MVSIEDIFKLIFQEPDNTSQYYYEDIDGWWDHESLPVTSSLWVAGCAILFVLTSVLLFLRRNYQPLKSRSPLLLWVTLTGELITISWACMRTVISRQNFPCVLFVMFFFLMPPFVFAPIVLRCWRLVMVSRLASTKTLLAVQATGNEYDSVKRRFAIFKILISTPFLLILSFVIVALHFVFLGIALAIDNQKISLKGCFAGLIVMGTAAVVTLFWGILALISAIITKILVREPWGVARGIMITTGVIISATLVWFILNLIPIFSTIIERYFPTGYFLFAALIFDIFFSTLLTVILTWTHRAKLNRKQSEIEDYKKGLLDILKDTESRKFLKDFAIKSFAPETVAFWETVENFRTVAMVKTTEDERKSAARRIVSDYIDPNGPLALNLTHANEWKNAIVFAIDDPAAYHKATQQKLKQKQTQEASSEQLQTDIQPQESETPYPQTQDSEMSDVILSQSLDASISMVMGIRNAGDDNVDFSLGYNLPGPDTSLPPTIQPPGESEEGTVYTDTSSQTGSESDGAQKGLMARSPAKREEEDITKLRADIFDELQHWVERDMAQDLYARFKESKHWSDMNTSISLRREMLKSGGII